MHSLLCHFWGANWLHSSLAAYQLAALKSLATPKIVEPGKDNWVTWMPLQGVKLMLWHCQAVDEIISKDIKRCSKCMQWYQGYRQDERWKFQTKKGTQGWLHEEDTGRMGGMRAQDKVATYPESSMAEWKKEPMATPVTFRC